jgi:ATP-dependent protease Clp ATPase subunit
MTTDTTQSKKIKSISRIFEIFEASDAQIRPHFFLTGPSGSGKSHLISMLAQTHDFQMIDVNAASLTKEGTAGNSLSKALSPLANLGSQKVIVFVDEFDKLFISGNANSDLAHETTNGVQNEFLKVLEGSAAVYGDWGKYIPVNTDNCLFVFAGAFNGEENIDLDRLREFGIKTEFLGRVGLVYGLEKMSLEIMKGILENSPLLKSYIALFPKTIRNDVVKPIMQVITEAFEKNTIGARMINTLIHQWFIEGGFKEKTQQKPVFNKTLELHN